MNDELCISISCWNERAPGSAYCAKCAGPNHVAQGMGGMMAKPTNPKDRAATTRLDLSLFPATAVAYGALAMQEGDCKYGAYNYREAGVLASVYRAAAQRHLDKWFNGEETDPDTGVPHLANALGCIAVIVDAIECGKLDDDRPPKCDVAGLLKRFEAKVAHLQKMFPNGPPRYRAKQP